jgi:hypothetical protein
VAITLVSTKSKPTLVDYGLIESGIKTHCENGVGRGIAFANYVTQTIFGVPPDQVKDAVVDGGHDRGIDIIYIDESNRVINICSCKCVANFKKATHNFPGDEIDKIISFIDDLLFHRDEMLNSVNGALATKIREIWELVGSGEGYNINVRLFSNQLTLAPSERNRLVTALERHRVSLFEHGLYELAHGVVRAVQPKFKKRLTPLNNAIAPHFEGDHIGYFFPYPSRIFLNSSPEKIRLSLTRN